MAKGLYKGVDSVIKDILKTSVLSKELKSKLRLLDREVRDMSRREKLLLDLVNIDGLTGLYNHKYFHESLDRELSKALRFKYSIALVMIDIDYFKKFNDTYGHPRGDAVLREIAKILRKNTRSYDIVSRYGGEEFAIILPHSSRRDARVLSEKVRKVVYSTPFYGVKKGKKEKVRITISAGVADYPANARTRSVLVNRADKALYMAKEEGRNAVCSSLITGRDYIRFAFCSPTLSPFYANVLRGVREVADEIGNVELEIFAGSSESGYREQLSLMNKAVSDGVDAIGICSKTDVGEVVKKANKSGIKVFVFNVKHVKMTPKGNITSFIGYDQKEAGAKAAIFLIRMLRGRGKVAVLEGIPDEIDSIERKEGFIKKMKGFPFIKIVVSEPADWDRIKAGTITMKILKKHPDIDAIFGLSDEMALGAVDAIDEKKKNGKIFTVGLDGNPNAFQAIRDGKLSGTLNTNPVEMGRIMIRTVLRSTFKDEVISKVTDSPTTMVDLENVDRYL